jgi:hypothetical protein
MMVLSLLLALWPQWQSSQNAVLFSAEHIAEARLAGEDVSIACETWKDWNDKTRVAPGQFERRPGYGDINSHDNMGAGMALGSVACNQPEIAMEIVHHIGFKGWAFNDVEPGKYDIRGQLTPKDWVPITVAAGFTPDVLSTVYASIDLCVGRSWNLKRARVLIYENSELPALQSLILAPCIWRAKRMVNYIEAGCNYHGEPFCSIMKSHGGAWSWGKVE